MNLEAALEWLYSTQQFGLKLGLEHTHRLLAALGQPHEAFRSIHVAGTNGKGSVCAMLEQMLRDQPIRTGLFTSPHLVRFNERIRINGHPISDDDVANGLTRLRELVTDWDPHPTFFELTTALAFDHFARERVEIAVIETGMGGRLDSTNVLTPLVSVITPISFDHQKWLGDTLAQIAGEKAGILKPGVPAVSAAQLPDARRVLETAGPVEFVEERFDGAIGIPGPHQAANAALALRALEASGLSLDLAKARDSLARVHWPGRFQRVDKFVLDGAHNPHSARALVTTWREQFGSEKVPMVFGMLRDKDATETLEILEEIASEFHFVAVRSARTRQPGEFFPAVRQPAFGHASLEEAVAALSSRSRVLITGSLFLIGEALAWLESAAKPRESDQ